MRKTAPILAVTVALCLTIPITGCNRADSEPVIAQVGDAALTLPDLRAMIPEETLARATREEFTDYLHQWVRQELLFQAAEEMGYGGDDRVQRRMAEARRDIMVDIFLEDELNMQPFISDDEISAYYQSNIDAFVRQEDEVRADILWFAEQAEASQARVAVVEGRTFTQVAADSSFRVIAADIDEGFLTRQELGEELGELVFSQQVGTLSNVLRAGASFVLIQAIERQEAGRTRTIEEVRGEIIMRKTSDLWEMKLDELLTRLLEHADVSVNAQAGFEALRGGRRP